MSSDEPTHFPCSRCPEEFDTARALASHLKVHRSDVPCPICKIRVRYLGPHLKSAHSDDPLYRFERQFLEFVAEMRELRTSLEIMTDERNELLEKLNRLEPQQD